MFFFNWFNASRATLDCFDGLTLEGPINALFGAAGSGEATSSAGTGLVGIGLKLYSPFLYRLITA
ncbi:hypothetical protein PshuTeo1_04370 [Pseudomonas hunanensis]|nr:hypothetical protein PshuTeo1_04370 [Pseudomonas hunanensis]